MLSILKKIDSSTHMKLHMIHRQRSIVDIIPDAPIIISSLLLQYFIAVLLAQSFQLKQVR